MGAKIIRDPIYDYIEVDDEYISIINSDMFQRLRRICQSSYSPLYPSSLHNRFTHSLGVFYLGTIAFKTFEKEITYKASTLNLNPKTIKNFVLGNEKLFYKACLLHDIGHAPFSHLSEKYYTNPKRKVSISEELDRAVGKRISPSNKGMAAEHEIVSATVGIRYFGYKDKENKEEWSITEKELFARCITGYKYEVKNNSDSRKKEKEIKNCLISLLNSNTIDVDKIDYLLRDSYMTGFPNLPIDYERLLKNITVVKTKDVETPDEKITLAYKKNAMSILEDVIYARDSEKKWIQSHPTVLYENYIIQRAIRLMNKCYNGDDETKHIVCCESLTQEGCNFQNGCSIRLFSDDDVIYAMKYFDELRDDPLIKEYFDRTKRRTPAWKSEFEYKALFGGHGPYSVGDGIDLKRIVNRLREWFEKKPSEVVNEDIINQMKDERDIEQNAEKKATLSEEIFFLEKLKEKLGNDFDLIFITSHTFSSGFGTSGSDLGEVLIEFRNIKPMKLKYAMPTLVSVNKTDNDEKTLFYPFWRGKSNNEYKLAEVLYEAIKETEKEKTKQSW